MRTNPFLKWAGGKRWLVDRPEFCIPPYKGKYIEPFLGGGAVFFSHDAKNAVLSDINERLINLYLSIRDNWQLVWDLLRHHQDRHSKDHYYEERGQSYSDRFLAAAQFLYLNRACWNGLYRENLHGVFNVPIGTKSTIVFETDDFASISAKLAHAELLCTDFEAIVDRAEEGDFIFADPPYTTAHNTNGFVKYNQRIFRWEDQIRLRDSLFRAKDRGASVCVTNADHASIRDLYSRSETYLPVPRRTVIGSSPASRKKPPKL